MLWAPPKRPITRVGAANREPSYPLFATILNWSLQNVAKRDVRNLWVILAISSHSSPEASLKVTVRESGGAGDFSVWETDYKNRGSWHNRMFFHWQSER